MELPEFYVNTMKLGISAFDVTLEFGVQESGDPPPDATGPTEVATVVRPTARIRMSLQYAIILSKVLDKAMHEYQAKNGLIQLPREVLTRLGVV